MSKVREGGDGDTAWVEAFSENARLYSPGNMSYRPEAAAAPPKALKEAMRPESRSRSGESVVRDTPPRVRSSGALTRQPGAAVKSTPASKVETSKMVGVTRASISTEN